MRRHGSSVHLAIAGLVVGVGLAQASMVLATSHDPNSGPTILVEDFAFTPADVEVGVGRPVTWTIGADPEQHTVTPVDGDAFEDSGQLFTGDTYLVRFDAPGSYAYLCTLHPFMTGTVTVVELPTTAPTAPTAPGSGVSPIASLAVTAAPPAVVDPVETDASGPPVAGLAVLAVVALVALGALVAARRRTT